MNKTELITAIMFTLIGGIFAALGIFLHSENSKFMETALSTEATITRIDSHYDSIDEETEYDVFVRFDVDGKIYNGELNMYHVGMQEGGTTTIYYNPNNPSDFRSSGSSFGTLLFAGIGGLFFIIGLVMLISKIKAKSSANALKINGTLVQAQINTIDLNTSYAVNGRNPYRLTASYFDPNTNKTLFFESKNIWFNVQAIVDSLTIKTVDVYIDPTNQKKYFVDVEALRTHIGN